jgi:RNA polymerase sigma factor (sigma-70 family)
MDTFSNDEDPDPISEEHFRRSYAILSYAVSRIYRNSVDADDVAQQAIAYALAHPERWQEARNKLAYLIAIAKNIANENLKPKLGKEAAEHIFEHKRTYTTGFEPYEGWQREEIIAVAKKTLKKREFEFFWLVHLERRYNLKQLAERWNYSHGYIRQYASQVYSKLRKALQRELQAQG